MSRTTDCQKVRMAGNAMNLACVGAFLLSAIMMMEPLK